MSLIIGKIFVLLIIIFMISVTIFLLQALFCSITDNSNESISENKWKIVQDESKSNMFIVKIQISWWIMSFPWIIQKFGYWHYNYDSFRTLEEAKQYCQNKVHERLQRKQRVKFKPIIYYGDEK